MKFITNFHIGQVYLDNVKSGLPISYPLTLTIELENGEKVHFDNLPKVMSKVKSQAGKFEDGFDLANDLLNALGLMDLKTAISYNPSYDPNEDNDIEDYDFEYELAFHLGASVQNLIELGMI